MVDIGHRCDAVLLNARLGVRAASSGRLATNSTWAHCSAVLVRVARVPSEAQALVRWLSARRLQYESDDRDVEQKQRVCAISDAWVARVRLVLEALGARHKAHPSSGLLALAFVWARCSQITLYGFGGC